MKNIKGPKSALSNFIEEHGIKVNKKDNINEQTIIKKQHNKNFIKHKKPKFEKTSEIGTLKFGELTLQDIIIKKIIKNIENHNLNDDQFELISSYLSRKRLFNLNFFKYFIKNCKKKLIIYDCSMIENDDFNIINSDIIHLELHQCGQLSNYKLAEILSKFTNLKILRITGGYLITEINLPKNIDILDLSNCNRLNNNIIKEINSKYKKLDELRLSYCYKITDQIKLKVDVINLYLDETRITEKFYKKKDLKILSIDRCINIDKLICKYDNLEILSADGITTLNNIHAKKLKCLNASNCFGLIKWIKKSDNILFEKLDISFLSFNSYDFLFNCRNLKELNLSWCDNITDELITNIIYKTNISKLTLFGCFNLTSKVAKLSYEKKDKITVIGNPSETKFLVNS